MKIASKPPQDPNQMEIPEHFTDIRTRLLRFLAWMLVGVAASLFIATPAARFLARPVGGLETLASIDVTENLSVFMRIVLLSAFTMALPWGVGEILGFFSPGMTAQEKRWVWVIIPLALALFVGGVAFAFYVMLPAALDVLLKFMGIETRPRPASYFSFITNLMFWVGIAFETPLAVMFLARFRIVRAGTLLRGWRVAIVVIAVLAAVVTPTGDPVNMALLMAPLLMLYLVSILLAFFAGERKPRRKKVRKPRKPFRLFRKKVKAQKPAPAPGELTAGEVIPPEAASTVVEPEAQTPPETVPDSTSGDR